MELLSRVPSGCVDPPTAIPPADASSCGSRAQHLRFASLPCPDGSCNIPAQESSYQDVQPQFGDVMLPSNGYNGSSNNSSVGGGGYSASLPPPAALPLPLCHGLSSDADYYGMVRFLTTLRTLKLTEFPSTLTAFAEVCTSAPLELKYSRKMTRHHLQGLFVYSP